MDPFDRGVPADPLDGLCPLGPYDNVINLKWLTTR